MAENWTPGPWRVFGAEESDKSAAVIYPGVESPSLSIIVFGCGYEDAGVRGSSRSERLANARLIAAAPDLYAALSALMPFIWEGGMKGETEWERAAIQARAALAKARGERPMADDTREWYKSSPIGALLSRYEAALGTAWVTDQRESATEASMDRDWGRADAARSALIAAIRSLEAGDA